MLEGTKKPRPNSASSSKLRGLTTKQKDRGDMNDITHRFKMLMTEFGKAAQHSNYDERIN